MSHTQGKLRVGFCRRIYTEDGRELAVVTKADPKLRANCAANAARLVKCWNEHEELVAQRDALLEACKEAENAMCGPYAHNDDPASPTHDPVMANARKLLRAAIAKAGGGE